MEIYCKMLQRLIDANTAVPMSDIANGLHLDTQDATSHFEYMLGQGWILPSRNDAGKIRITNAGRQQCQLLLEQRQLAQDALQSLQSMDENMRRNHAEEKAEKAKDRRFQLVNTLLGALAGALPQFWHMYLSPFLACSSSHVVESQRRRNFYGYS